MGKKPGYPPVQHLPLQRWRGKAWRVAGPAQGHMRRCSPPRCLLPLPAQATGRNVHVPKDRGSPMAKLCQFRIFLSDSASHWLVLEFFLSLVFTRVCRAIWGVNPRGGRRKATIFDVYTNGLLLGAPRNAPLDIGMAEAVGGDNRLRPACELGPLETQEGRATILKIHSRKQMAPRTVVLNRGRF